MIDFFTIAHAAWPILNPAENYAASDLIRTAVALVVLVGWLCSILFIVWGGLMLILSGWKDEKVKPAINSIRYAVIGIVVIVIAIFVAPEVMSLLGIGDYDYLSPSNIFTEVKRLMVQVFWGGTTTYDPSATTGVGKDFSKF